MDARVRVSFVARRPRCKEDPLSVGEIRTVASGADIAVTCRACGRAAALTVVETPHACEDESSKSIPAGTGAGAETGELEQSPLLAKLDEALEHARGVGRCLDAFVEPGAHAQKVPPRALQILAIASSLLDTLDEALATSRNSITNGW